MLLFNNKKQSQSFHFTVKNYNINIIIQNLAAYQNCLTTYNCFAFFIVSTETIVSLP